MDQNEFDTCLQGLNMSKAVVCKLLVFDMEIDLETKIGYCKSAEHMEGPSFWYAFSSAQEIIDDVHRYQRSHKPQE